MSDEEKENISLESLGLGILNIPQELINGCRWAVSTMKVIDPFTGRIDKAPRHPKTGEMLSVTEPEKWATFHEAMNSGYPAKGFLLTSDDEYTVIDLDHVNDGSEDDIALAKKIYSTFDTYAERSASGKGIHMILKGVNQAGRRRGNVEVYSQERYIISTGKVVKKKDIAWGGKSLENLINSMRVEENPDTYKITYDLHEQETDESVMRRMFEAANGDVVKKLFTEIPSANADWSQLDAQLAHHIAFYTAHKQQALRIFRKSALYRGEGTKHGRKKRGYERVEKYEDDYLLRRTFGRSWHKIQQQREEESKISDDALKALQDKARSQSDEKIADVKIRKDGEYANPLGEITKPRGLVGEIAQYIYDTAHRPFWEVAIAGALTFTSGLCGRHYNIGSSNLGLYIILVAGTGRGKSAADRGISRIIREVSQHVPAVYMFQGGSDIASGQGLIKSFMGEEGDSIPSKFMFLEEFGHTMKILTARDASTADLKTRQALLKLYTSGRNNRLNSILYSDVSKNTGVIDAPNLSFFGDTTPDTFFKSLNSDVISDGTVPRFLIIEYLGPRVEANDNTEKEPPENMIVAIQTLIHQIVTMRDTDSYVQVGMDDDAREVLNEFRDFADAIINDEVEGAEIWNRADENARRVAANIAVGANLYEPRITKEDALWSVNLVKRSMKSINLRYEDGTFGEGESQLEKIVKKHITKFFTKVLDDGVPVYGANQRQIENGFVPYGYLYNSVKNVGSFKNSTRGANMALSGVIQALTHQGYINEINGKELEQYDGKVLRTYRCFGPGDNFVKVGENT